MKNDKLLSGIIAVGSYFLLLILVFVYFNYRSDDRSAHYVEKRSKSIAVSLVSPNAKPTKPSTTKRASENQKKPKRKPKRVRNTKAKKLPPKKIKHVKKSKSPPKKISASSLFSGVTPSQKSKPKSDAIKKAEQHDRGIENRYIAKIEKLLKGWPAQANYAGETISVALKVYPNGTFDYTIIKLSGNAEFNEALQGYLRQLQSIGFDAHSFGHVYTIDVAFVAKE